MLHATTNNQLCFAVNVVLNVQDVDSDLHGKTVSWGETFAIKNCRNLEKETVEEENER